MGSEKPMCGDGITRASQGTFLMSAEYSSILLVPQVSPQSPKPYPFLQGYIAESLGYYLPHGHCHPCTKRLSFHYPCAHLYHSSHPPTWETPWVWLDLQCSICGHCFYSGLSLNIFLSVMIRSPLLPQLQVKIHNNLALVDRQS